MNNEKKYNELVGKIKKAYLNAQTNSTKAVLEDILPELKEGEDERIRKTLIEYFNAYPKDYYGELKKSHILAWLEKQESVGEIVERCKTSWYNEGKIQGQIEGLSDEEKYQQGWHDALEKQGEQKPADKTKPKFHEGQWIVWQDKCYKVNYNGCGYELVDQNGLSTSLEYGTVDENAHIWDITKDARVGDVLASKDKSNILIFRNLDTSTSFSSYYNTAGKGELGWSNECFIPATKEQRNQLEKAMVNAGYTFDFEKKELKKIEQKSADKDEPKVDNRPVTERIKTFEDALEVLGDEHPLVKEYWGVVRIDFDISKDLYAYLKLRVIVAALNEGWEPKFEKGEYRYYPWFYLYTKEQYDELDDEEKGRCVLRSGHSTSSNYGFVSCSANADASSSHTSYGSRLVFRTRELAAYAGRQFTEEWADFVFKTE